MAASQTINLNDFPSFVEDLGKDAQSDLEPLFKRIALVLAYHSRQCFDESRGPSGESWKPLKRPRSGARHRGSSSKPLLDTGLLAASTSARGADHIEKITATSLEFGSAVFYADWMLEACLPLGPLVTSKVTF